MGSVELVKFADENGLAFGRCRRRAPEGSGWPLTLGEQWCGDYRGASSKPAIPERCSNCRFFDLQQEAAK